MERAELIRLSVLYPLPSLNQAAHSASKVSRSTFILPALICPKLKLPQAQIDQGKIKVDQPDDQEDACPERATDWGATEEEEKDDKIGEHTKAAYGLHQILG